MNYKNPFAIRASERIETDEMFLELFASEPLSYLEEQNNKGQLWGRVTNIFSSPGAGKTTLLRLFSPSILQRVTERYGAYRELKKLGVLNSERIHRCSVYLQMGRDYEFIEDDELFGQMEQKRIFLSLINSRIVLATLKSCMTLAKIRYTELEKITYTPANPVNEFGELKAEYNGKELLNWAAEQERRICDFFDNFIVPEGGIKGCNDLFALSAMKASWFRFKDEPLCDEFIFQIDDGHKLTDNQKKIIRSETVEARRDATLWIAQRLETLSTEDILCDNNIKGRDDQVIHLGNLKKGIFSQMVKNIATLRSAVSSDGIILSGALASDTTVNYKALYDDASKKNLRALESLPNYENFCTWAKSLSDGNKEPYEKALLSRSMLMYASRQRCVRLFDYELSDMEGILNDFNTMSEDLLPAEIKRLPQYYGFQILIELASQNIEQFLELSANMYELLVAKKISDPSSYVLTAEEQDEIVREFATSRLDKIKRLPRGNKIYDFLMKLIDFCKKQTFTPSYSYRTVSGFAISEENCSVSSKDGFWFQDPANANLTTILKDCLAYNFLFKENPTQGKKDQKWTVFYLNSWLCAYARLPLKRGGWRKLSLSKLNKWVNPTT